MNIPSRTALVTGASYGIGRAISRGLAHAGYRVLMVARSEAQLQEIGEEIRQQGGQASYYVCDLSDPDAIDALVRYVHSEFPRLDVLVNNAGIGWYGRFTDVRVEVAESLLMVNIFSLVRLTREVLPAMLQANSGHIINISSIVGDLPVQGVALYSASKTFVNSFSKALAREVSRTRVRVSVVKPGPVRSNFSPRAVDSGSLPIPGERFAVRPEQVAGIVLQCLRTPRRVVYVPGLFQFFPLVDLVFGGIIDRLGLILLRKPS